MSAYNYSSAALVIVVGLLPLCLVVRFIGMVYLSDCQKPYPDETGHRDGKIERQKMEEINHAKLQFFTNITHELLTPLSIISASVDELKQEVPASSSVCSVIADNTVRLIRLIQQILEFRKVENGKLRLKVSHGNVSMFLKNQCRLSLLWLKSRNCPYNLICLKNIRDILMWINWIKWCTICFPMPLNILLKEELLWCRRLMMRKRGLLN